MQNCAELPDFCADLCRSLFRNVQSGSLKTLVGEGVCGIGGEGQAACSLALGEFISLRW